MKYDHDAICKYIRTLKEGEKVVETGGCMSGMGGTIIMSKHPYKDEDHLAVAWDSPEAISAMGGLMTTSITGGTRRLHEVDLTFLAKEPDEKA